MFITFFNEPIFSEKQEKTLEDNTLSPNETRLFLSPSQRDSLRESVTFLFFLDHHNNNIMMLCDFLSGEYYGIAHLPFLL